MYPDFGSDARNPFDCLPDHVLLLVFNKLHDAKYLSLTMCVCKRFRSIIPEVGSIFLSIPSHYTIRNASRSSHGGDNKTLFKSFLSRVLVKPLLFLLQALRLKPSSRDSDKGCSYYMPHEVLKPFRDVMSLEIKLPESNSEMGSSELLRWRAEFGSQLKSCVLVGASSISRTAQMDSCDDDRAQDLRIGEDGFKLRIIWSISCLIAATARQFLVQKTVKDHENLQDLVVTDERNQGRVRMNCEEIRDMETISMNAGLQQSETAAAAAAFPLDGTEVPPLMMKLWYVPELKLPASGSVMKGATLVVIKPVVGSKKAEGCRNWVAEAFDGGGQGDEVFGEAARELMKKEKNYMLEIYSF